jgi:conjugal transfer ATP-binding protein TraC
MGRRGQLFNFNPFYRIGGGGNYNVVVIAPPGSGKTFKSAGACDEHALHKG